MECVFIHSSYSHFIQVPKRIILKSNIIQLRASSRHSVRLLGPSRRLFDQQTTLETCPTENSSIYYATAFRLSARNLQPPKLPRSFRYKLRNYPRLLFHATSRLSINTSTQLVSQFGHEELLQLPLSRSSSRKTEIQGIA